MTEEHMRLEDKYLKLKRKQKDANELLAVSLIALEKGKLHIVQDHIERAISYTHNN